MSSFDVSVVITVLNAVDYLQEAVDSCLIQPEVIEVFIVDDGSTDGSLELAKKIAQQEKRVISLHHPEHQNLGIGASRNLAISRARGTYIAFLDADDWFFPDRFAMSKQVVQEHKDVDAIYEALICKYNSEAHRKAWIEKGFTDKYTLSRPFLPEELYRVIVEQKHGHFLPSGVTVKKSTFDKVGLFSTMMKVFYEDVHLFMRIAAIGKFYPGEIEKPVGAHRVHGENTMGSNTERNVLTGARVDEDILHWLTQHCRDSEKGKLLMLRAIIDYGKYYLQFGPKAQRRKLLWRKIRQLFRDFPQYRSPKASALAVLVTLGLFPLMRKLVLLVSR